MAMRVRAKPWISIQPSVRDVLHDVAQGVVQKEDVWVSAYIASPARASVHTTLHVEHTSTPPQTSISNQPSDITVDTSIEPWCVSSQGDVSVPRTEVHLPVQGEEAMIHDVTAPLSVDMSIDAEGVERYVMGGAQGQLVYGSWDMDTPFAETNSCGSHQSDITSVRFFPSGQVILATSLDMRASVVSALDGTCPRVLIGHTRAVLGSAILGRGREVATCSADGAIRLWDVSRGETVQTWDAGVSIPSLEVSKALDSTPEDRQGVLVAGRHDGVLQGYDMRTGSAVWSHTAPMSPLGGSECAIQALAMHENTMALGTRGGVCALYDLRAMQEPLDAWYRNTAEITCMHLTNQRVYIGTSDGLPYSVDRDTDQVHEYAGWDADAISAIRTDQAGHVIITGSGRYATYR